ncbi:hypothetical protein GN958_ATG18896 [Phytophthora infestans]|nr:hypothetical protein GN958_ATG18896 [Phytophthora infestans]
MGYGVLATEARAVFKACPALTSFFIKIDCVRNNRPESHYVNSAIYGDELWETAAMLCPLLTSIEMVDASQYPSLNSQSINGLSDRTLIALAQLKYLTSVEFCIARLTGTGIFDWLCRVAKFDGYVGPERRLRVTIGGLQHAEFCKDLPDFYGEIVVLLSLLSEVSEEGLGAASCQTKPLLEVVNPYESVVSCQWSKIYMVEKLRPLIEAVRAKHPSLQVSVSLFGQKSCQFSRIGKLTLDWQSHKKGEAH